MLSTVPWPPWPPELPASAGPPASSGAARTTAAASTVRDTLPDRVPDSLPDGLPGTLPAAVRGALREVGGERRRVGGIVVTNPPLPHLPAACDPGAIRPASACPPGTPSGWPA